MTSPLLVLALASAALGLSLRSPSPHHPVPPFHLQHQQGDSDTSDILDLLPNGTRKATKGQLWPQDSSSGLPTLYYRLDDPNIDHAAVEAALDHWREHSCILFNKVDSSYTGNHVEFKVKLCH